MPPNVKWDPGSNIWNLRSGSSSSSNWLEVLRRRWKKRNFRTTWGRLNKTTFTMVWCTVYVLYIYIYIYIYALYHLGYKTKSWNLKMVWCLLLLPCEGWSCFKVWARLVFSAVAWRKNLRKNLPTLKARTMNAPAVLKVIHNYKLLLHFMSTSDETSNLFQVTMCCLEECQDSWFHLTSRLHCRG